MSYDENVITIERLGKGKRVVVFLVELFVNFLISLFLFSVIIFPIAENTPIYKDVETSISQKQEENVKFLYDQKFLLYTDDTKEDFTKSMEYTAKQYVLSLISTDKGYDPFHYYFVEKRGYSEDKLKSIYQENDTKYFDFDSKVALKEQYYNEFLPLLDEDDVLSSMGQTDYSNFIIYFFPKMYSFLINDLLTIQEGELSTYYQNNKAIDGYRFTYQMIVTVCVAITYVISCLVSFLLFPLITKKGKTITLMAFRITRTGVDTLRVISTKERVILFFMQSLFYLSLVIFIPMLYITFGELFSITPLLFVSLASLVTHIVSLVFLILDQNGRTLMDKATKTVLIEDVQLDKINDVKGIKIDHV